MQSNFTKASTSCCGEEEMGGGVLGGGGGCWGGGELLERYNTLKKKDRGRKRKER